MTCELFNTCVDKLLQSLHLFVSDFNLPLNAGLLPSLFSQLLFLALSLFLIICKVKMYLLHKPII